MRFTPRLYADGRAWLSAMPTERFELKRHGLKPGHPLLLVRNLLPRRRRRREHVRLVRHDDPGDDVSQEADSGHEGHNEPHHADERNVEIKILCHAQANTGDLAAFTGTDQPLAGDRAADAGSTIRTYIGIVLNGLTAIVA